MINVNVPKSAFNEVYLKYMDDITPIQIFFGGGSSGKSKFLAQRDVIDVMKGGRNFLICRQVGRTLRGSVIQEVIKVITEWNLLKLFTINKTDGRIICKNGYEIVFVGLDDVEKLKSIVPAKGVWTDIRIEESTEVERSSIKQLLIRQRGGDERIPKRLVMSFNPILQSHFLYTDYFSAIGWADDQREYRDENILIVKTTYLDNQFLTSQDRQRLASEIDPYYRAVYVEGRWGILGNVIFTNWEVRDLTDMADQFTNHRNGLDFGFSSDPAALWVSHYDRAHKTIYVYDEMYERGLTNDMLAAELKKRIHGYVTCDSAEPKSIQELQNAGISAIAAKKGKDSVSFGIQWLQQQRIIIDTKCVNTKNEISTYHWKEDKDGNAMRVPTEKNNHLIDAGRYALEDDMEETWHFG